MFSTCIFCHSGLGTNELIEHFPVGRRLAFDPAKGRLWAVCAHCGRWNLSPIEERWEAIEECERRFRATTLRVSTEHIGLARLSEGLALVRVGSPLRPEFAAWRYGEQIGLRHRRRAVAAAGAVGAVATAALVGGAATMLLAAVPIGLWVNARGLPRWMYARRVVARIPAGQHHAFTVRGHHLDGTRLLTGESGESWRLRIAHDGGDWTFGGGSGVRAVGHLMAGMNGFGATRVQVDDAVSMMDRVGDADRYLASVANLAGKLGDLALPALPHEVRLAIEMSAHEEAERRALEGELAALEEAWRLADEVASIADGLVLPSVVHDFIRRLSPVSRT